MEGIGGCKGGSGMMLVLKGRLPCLNDVINANRTNRYAGATLKREIQDSIALALTNQVKERYTGKVIIFIRYFEKDNRRDEDNVMSGAKFILDALQEMKVIKNDSRKYVHLLQEVFTDKKEPRIEIEIKEVHRQMMCDDRYSKKDKDLKVPKHCEVCGEVFIPFEIIDDTSFRGWDICSLKCLDIWADLKKQKITKHCEFCGKEFQTIVISKKTCSDNCRKKLSLKKKRNGINKGVS